jgi:HSP20 family protein
MELVRYLPQTLLATRNTPFARLFDDFFAPFAGTGDRPDAEAKLPSVDIYEKERTICIDAELPGVAKENIHIDVKGRLLTLSGESKGANEVKDENTYRRERKYGRFERTFNLAFDINPETIVAKYENGILSLVIPRPEEQKPKQVTIQ